MIGPMKDVKTVVKLLQYEAVTLLIVFMYVVGIALQCYSWRDSNDALPVSCDLGCASVTLKGWNRITTKQLSLSIGMCNDGACNTTCNRALKLVRNFDLKECNASCCNHDLCNTNSTSPNPTEQRAVQTQAKPRMTRKTEDKSTGLKCYKCEEGKDFHDCNNEEDIDYCGPEHNSCFSITGTLSRDSSDVITHRGCGLEMIDCNITQLCIDTRNKLSVNHGLEMKTCTAYCCRGPFCNKYIPTRPADDDITTIVTTRARRTVKRSQSSSMKCYECKPDTFESLCTTNVTEKACVTGSGGYDGCFTMTATITNATSGQVSPFPSRPCTTYTHTAGPFPVASMS